MRHDQLPQDIDFRVMQRRCMIGRPPRPRCEPRDFFRGDPQSRQPHLRTPHFPQGDPPLRPRCAQAARLSMDCTNVQNVRSGHCPASMHRNRCGQVWPSARRDSGGGESGSARSIASRTRSRRSVSGCRSSSPTFPRAAPHIFHEPESPTSASSHCPAPPIHHPTPLPQ